MGDSVGYWGFVSYQNFETGTISLGLDQMEFYSCLLQCCLLTLFVCASHFVVDVNLVPS